MTDLDLGKLLNGLLGGSGTGSGNGSGASGDILGGLLGALSGKGGQNGGNPLSGLLDMLTKSGLMEQAQSWVGTGQNQPVTGDQIAEALPDDALRKAADQAGVSTQEAASQLAETLPRAVDKLTPNGELPRPDTSLEELIRRTA
ncbi:YidB family protein [Streptomyces sp. NPDC086787]|uniref:YidB family protein n=1 Tax=Streptomyces sp. NPDC086787 TaxID=3365759 RepID=UPI0037F9C5ED